MPFPTVNPIDSGWFERRAPVDHLGPNEFECPNCGPVTGDRYRAILGGHGGVGAPAVVRLFLKRKSTAGKIGSRSHWMMCTQCTALIPEDENAKRTAADLGLARGFGVKPA